MRHLSWKALRGVLIGSTILACTGAPASAAEKVTTFSVLPGGTVSTAPAGTLPSAAQPIISTFTVKGDSDHPNDPIAVTVTETSEPSNPVGKPVVSVKTKGDLGASISSGTVDLDGPTFLRAGATFKTLKCGCTATPLPGSDDGDVRIATGKTNSSTTDFPVYRRPLNGVAQVQGKRTISAARASGVVTRVGCSQGPLPVHGRRPAHGQQGHRKRARVVVHDDRAEVLHQQRGRCA